MKPARLLPILPLLLALSCSRMPEEEPAAKAPRATPAWATKDRSAKALSHPLSGMGETETDRFILGKSFFRIPWVEAPSATTARDGLGPLFSANTCITCHPNNGAGVPLDAKGTPSRSLVFRLSRPVPRPQGDTLGFVPDPVYGNQISVNGVFGVPYEGRPAVAYTERAGTYPDGTTYSLRVPAYSLAELHYGPLADDTVLAPRIGPALIGLGLLERVSDDTLLALEDPDDKNGDGVSGRANRVWSPELNATVIGRYTWKASASSVRVQTAAAMHNDMGLTTSLFPEENCMPSQKTCREAPKGAHPLDAPDPRLDAVAYYVSNLKTPLPRNPKEHTEGAELFRQIGCAACHLPTLAAGETPIHPYTDLLLHDMGEGLADGRSEFLAHGGEWRTAPLWGLGLRKTTGDGDPGYLHDGRARSVEEAILWHGGEGETAKRLFTSLEKNQRATLLAFLESL